jgi:protein involved in polysaccharide export with SLBB domain
MTEIFTTMNPLRKILRFLNAILALGCAILLVGCSQETPAIGNAVITPSDATGTKKIHSAPRDISIGDRIEIFVREDASFNAIYSVRESGDIIIPKVGRIKVSGLSIPEAETKIKGALEPDQLQVATVIVDRLQYRHHSPSGKASMIIYLTGKVRAPGQHSIPINGETRIGLYEALLIGGGITKFADIQKIHALRTGKGGLKTKISMNVRGINQGKAADLPARSGDIIVVPERIFGF